jgi:hypothetical protein
MDSSDAVPREKLHPFAWKNLFRPIRLLGENTQSWVASLQEILDHYTLLSWMDFQKFTSFTAFDGSW